MSAHTGKNIEDQPKTSFFSGAFINLAGVGYGGALTFVNEILAARYLGVAVYGLFALGMLVTRIGEIISIFGLRISVMHFIPLHLKQGDNPKLLGKIIGSLCLSLLISCGLTLYLYHTSNWLAADIFDMKAAEPYIRFLCFVIPALALTNLIGHIARGYGFSLYYVVIRNFIPPTIYCIALVFLMRNEMEPFWITVVYNATYFFALLVAGFILVKITGKTLWTIQPDLQFKELYYYAWPVFINTILYMLVGWTDIFMVGYFLDSEHMGIYRGCAQVVVVLDMMSVSIGVAIAHLYPLLNQDQNKIEFRNIFWSNIRWTTMLICPTAAVIAINADFLLNLMGEDFRPGVNTLVILATAFAIKACFTAAGILLLVTKRQSLETKIAVLVAIINVVLNYFLVPKYGINGAAYATLSSFILLSLLRIIVINKVVKLGIRLHRIVRVLFCAVFIALAVNYAFNGTGIIHAVTKSSIYALLVIIALWRYVMTSDEKLSILKKIKAGD